MLKNYIGKLPSNTKISVIINWKLQIMNWKINTLNIHEFGELDTTMLKNLIKITCYLIHWVYSHNVNNTVYDIWNIWFLPI